MEQEIYVTHDDVLAIFLGTWGGRGVLVYRDHTWDLHASGSTRWDSLHQEVYRNHRAQPLTPPQLFARGVPMPSSEILAMAEQTVPLRWENNFACEAALDKIPKPLSTRLRQCQAVYIVLEEDEYETALGDGLYRYLDSVFWDEAAARDYVLAKDREGAAYRAQSPQQALWYKYTLKQIAITVDPRACTLLARLEVGPYEHYDLSGILRKLA